PALVDIAHAAHGLGALDHHFHELLVLEERDARFTGTCVDDDLSTHSPPKPNPEGRKTPGRPEPVARTTSPPAPRAACGARPRARPTSPRGRRGAAEDRIRRTEGGSTSEGQDASIPTPEGATRFERRAHRQAGRP